jgi:uncharacterized protein (DUF885 family)
MIKRLLLSLLAASTLFLGCQKNGPGPEEIKGNEAFGGYETNFLEALWKVAPDRGASEGYHKYDSLLVIPNQKSRDALINFTKIQSDSISRFEITKLSESNQMDYHMMQNELDYINWQLTVLKAYEWNPTHYNIIASFAGILNGHYAPLAKRMRNFYEKMAKLPEYYKEAEKQIKNPVVELTDQAIEQQTGGIAIMEKDFADSLRKSNIPKAEQKQMTDRAKIATDAINGYIAWLKNLKNDHPRSFRLGKTLYEDKFKYETQSAFTAQQLFNAANERKKQVHREMTKISRQLWPKYFGQKAMPTDSLEMISQMLDKLSEKHTTPEEFQSTIQRQLPKLSAFIRAKDLLTLDPSKPLLVRLQPAYFASPTIGSMSSPGPYDKNENSYFNVASLTGMPADKAESLLREYNDYMLQILCIHEAIPGHYVQLVYANKSPSMVKSIFGSNAMIEGWAVYGEQMMLDNGYDDSPEMRLMWYKWHLRSVCNTILDYAVHCNNIPKEQAMTLLTHEAFQQQAEAEGKWKRVSVTSVQLDSYYDGYKEIMDLREAWKTKMAAKYKLKDFNEKFLSYGSAPVKYIKGVMIGNK